MLQQLEATTSVIVAQVLDWGALVCIDIDLPNQL